MADLTLGRALKSYKPKKQDGLAFKKGQTIVLLERDEEQRLFRGEFSSKRGLQSGWFPYDAIKVLTPAESEAERGEIMERKVQKSKSQLLGAELNETEGGDGQGSEVANDPEPAAAAAADGGERSRLRGLTRLGSSRRVFGKEKSTSKDSVAEEKSVFGGTLGQCMYTSYTEFRIPPMIELIVNFLRGHALREEGIFRLSGSTAEVEELKIFWDANNGDVEATRTVDLRKYQVHSLASVLKLYLRELSDPLFTFELYDEWLEALASNQDVAERIKVFGSIARKLPEINYVLYKFLFDLLVDVAKFSDENKMTPNNLAIVFGPTLLRKRGEQDAMADMLGNQDLVGIVEVLIENFKEVHRASFPKQKKHGSSSRGSRREKSSRGKKDGKGETDVAIKVIQTVDLDGNALPEGWEMAIDGKGRAFFIDHVNQKTSWKDPRTGEKYKPKS